MAAAAVLFAYWLNIRFSADVASVRTASFVAIILVDLALIFGIRAPSRLTKASVTVSVLTLLALSLICLVPMMQAAFGFAEISFQQLGMAALAAGVAYATTLGAMRLTQRGRLR
jgi:hypothetical protein